MKPALSTDCYDFLQDTTGDTTISTKMLIKENRAGVLAPSLLVTNEVKSPRD